MRSRRNASDNKNKRPRIEKFPSLEPSDYQEIVSFLPSQPGLITAWDQYKKQQEWASYCWATVNQAANLFARYKNFSCAELYTYLAGARRLIGKELGHSSLYGCFRNSNSRTYNTIITKTNRFNDQYQHLIERLPNEPIPGIENCDIGFSQFVNVANDLKSEWNKALKGLGSSKFKNLTEKSIETYKKFLADLKKINIHEYDKKPRHQLFITLPFQGQMHIVTRVCLISDWFDAALLNYCKGLNAPGIVFTSFHPEIIIFHSHGKHISTLFAELDLHLQTIRDDSLNSEEKLKKIILMACYLYNVIPLQLGGAATSSMFVKVLMKLNSLPYNSFLSGGVLAADIEAMSTPLEKFIQQSITMLAHPQVNTTYQINFDSHVMQKAKEFAQLSKYLLQFLALGEKSPQLFEIIDARFDGLNVFHCYFVELLSLAKHAFHVNDYKQTIAICDRILHGNFIVKQYIVTALFYKICACAMAEKMSLCKSAFIDLSTHIKIELNQFLSTAMKLASDKEQLTRLLNQLSLANVFTEGSITIEYKQTQKNNEIINPRDFDDEFFDAYNIYLLAIIVKNAGKKVLDKLMKKAHNTDNHLLNRSIPCSDLFEHFSIWKSQRKNHEPNEPNFDLVQAVL